MAFTHLHVHTQYSLLDGFSDIKKLVAKVKSLGMDSCAVTDHGVMFGVVDFYKECTANGIKPVLGCEIYTAERGMHQKDSKMDWNNYHLVLLAETDEGYKNLMKIVSASYTKGFYRKPRADYELLEKHSKGLIALTGCIAGRVPQYLLSGDEEGAKNELKRLVSIFGKDNLFVELQDHDLEEEKRVSETLIRMAREEGLGLVCTNDSHYTEREDWQYHDVLLCVQTATNMSDPKRMKFNNDSYYVKSEDEMRELFSYIPEALENTHKIAQRCNVNIEFHNYHLPKYTLEPGMNSGEYLRRLCEEGLGEKYDRVTDELKERLYYELEVIDSMQFNDYFLIVWDFIKYAKDNSISVGPGRGSAAGSLVAYCLGITEVDPIEYNLIFERFLNNQRISMPDIDIDFCYENRHKVIEYVIEKYGETNVAQIITFGTLGAKNAIRDVGRSLGMSYADVDRVAKEIPSRLGTTISSALDENPALREMAENDEQIKNLIEISRALEGTPRHASTHAAGVVITDIPIDEYVPLYVNDGNTATQFPMTLIEELGLLKMDFLGLRTLTVIKDTIENISRAQSKTVSVNPKDLPFDDQNVYHLISKGDTLGVFQLESSGMRAFMQNLKPDKFEDIIAGISLYRPGPMQYIDTYVANKKDPSRIRYISPALEPILNVTYGCMVYQEQVMQIVRDLAGYSMGDSDNVRRAMSKKKEKEMQAERVRFVSGDKEHGIAGCIANGISEAEANEIFNQMTDFASYAFNKSHAAAYAVISYQTAFLKTYYPTEFMAALLTSIIGDDSKISKYIKHLRDMDIQLLNPDINESFERFTVSGGKVRYGLLAVKGLGESAVAEIINTREEQGEFRDFSDFIKKIPFHALNKRGTESLIKSGAFDSLGHSRKQLMMVFSEYIDAEQRSRKQVIEGQLSLFDLFGDAEIAAVSYEMPSGIKEYDTEDLLQFEKEVLGVYISGHPLSKYSALIENYATLDSVSLNPSDEEEPPSDGEYAIVSGLISAVKSIMTKDNKPMAFLTLEDLYGTFEAVVFSKQYEEKAQLLKKDIPLLIKGRVSLRDEVFSISVSSLYDMRDERSLSSLKPVRADQKKAARPLSSGERMKKTDSPVSADETPKIKKIPEDAYILVELSSRKTDLLVFLKEMMEHNGGSVKVVLHDTEKDKKYLADKSLWVSDDIKIVGQMREIMGYSSVRLVGREGEYAF